MTAPISHVNVWPVDDELLVTWRGGGDVSVFVSNDPADAGANVGSPDKPGRVTVPRRGRPYIHLFDPVGGFTVAAERVLSFDSVRNFRDLGGYPTLDGSTTRWGQVFRSGRLDKRTNADTDRILSLGISTVFDLRTTQEVESRPDRLPDVINHVHVPMSSDITQQQGLFDRILTGQMSGFTKVDMADGYLRMLDNFPEYLARMVSAVAAGEKVLFHCAAGKDRTGITAIVLLGIADVADSYVLDDYELSASHQPEGVEDRFAAAVTDLGLNLERFDLAAMMGAPRRVMKMTLDGLRERWTDHAGFQATLGLTPAELVAARSNLRSDAV